MTRRRLATIALCTTAVLAPFAACNVYDETLLVNEGGASSSSGDLPAGRGIGYWSGESDAGCPSARRPVESDAPRGTTHNEAEDDSIVLALRSIDLGTLDPFDGGLSDTQYNKLGFDVDGLCTGASRTCPRSDGVACEPLHGQIAVDGEYCRDNGFGNLASALTRASQLTSGFGFGTFDCALCQGTLNYLVRIKGYNGLPDDDAVDVDFFPSAGLESARPAVDCTASLPDNVCFTTAEPWNIDRKVVKGGAPGLAPSTLAGTSAFVKDSYVTIFLPETLPIYFPGDDSLIRAFPITVHGGFITGHLSKQADGRWRVDDGLIGGSTRVDEVLQSLESIGLCKDNEYYPTAVTVVENVADLLVSGRVAPKTPCDAVSVAVGFTALQATLGKSVEVPVRDYCSGSGDAGADSGARDGG